jgi:protein NrfD
MIEYTSTRANPMIDPQMHVWGWEIPVYLFFGGLVAGLMILSGYHILRAQWDKDQDHGHYVTAPLLSLILLSIGMGTLFLDLEHKFYVWRLYLTFKIASPMSWGAWILLFVYPVLIGSFFISLPETLPGVFKRFPWLGKLVDGCRQPRILQLIGFGNIGLGILLGIYTGILLSALGARPLWSSALLGPLFLFSGLSTGAATLHILSHINATGSGSYRFTDAVMSSMVHWIRPRSDDEKAEHKLTQADNSFLTVELFILILFLIGLMSASEVQQQAAQLLLIGSYAAAFWVFIIGIGILVPLVLQFLQAMNRIRNSILPALLVILGGLLLRFVIVYAGQESHWMMAVLK